MPHDDVFEILKSGEDADFVPTWQACRAYTTTSLERGLAIYRATRYIVEHRVPGVFVACGIGQGGAVMIALKTLQLLDAGHRRFILFDTFCGMTEPGPFDQDYRGNHASPLPGDTARSAQNDRTQREARLNEVRATIAAVGYDDSKIRFRAGDVRRTLAKSNLPGIAWLRLNTHYYDSTYAELTYLYPRLVQQGILQVDGYGHWRGAQKAVDDYFAEIGPAPLPRPPRPFLHWIDYSGRIAVRPDPPEEELPSELVRDPARTWGRAERDGLPIPRPEQRYDYVPAGLSNPNLLRYFPSLTANDPRRNKWPYLRSAAPHIWRTDERSINQNIGVLSLEEAIVLHHLALPYAGQRGLAIGCHYGWSTAHLLAAHLHLDVVDPKLSRDDQWDDVQESLAAVPTNGSFRLWAAYSPSILPALRETKPAPWSFVLIDGDHEGDAPRRDAELVSELCAEDATVVLHDLISPHVAAGLEVFRRAGWSVLVYNTMQVLGVAWRGKFAPVKSPVDSRMPPLDLPHLQNFPQAH